MNFSLKDAKNADEFEKKMRKGTNDDNRKNQIITEKGRNYQIKIY